MIVSVVTLPTGQLVTVGAQDVMVYTVVISTAEVIVVREVWPALLEDPGLEAVSAEVWTVMGALPEAPEREEETAEAPND